MTPRKMTFSPLKTDFSEAAGFLTNSAISTLQPIEPSDYGYGVHRHLGGREGMSFSPVKDEEVG